LYLVIFLQKKGATLQLLLSCVKYLS